MKFKKPSSKSVQDQAAIFGGAVVGGAASNGVVKALHKPTGLDPKKDKNTDLMIRGGMAAVSAYAGAAIVGNDTASTLVKGMLLGIAATQAVECVKVLVADSPAMAKDTAFAKFAKDSLGCGCSQQASLGRAYRKGGRLRQPNVDYLPEYTMLDQRQAPYSQNSFDAAMQQGALISA